MHYMVYKGFELVEPEGTRFENEEEAKAFYDEIDIERFHKLGVAMDASMAKHRAYKTLICVLDGGYEDYVCYQYSSCVCR